LEVRLNTGLSLEQLPDFPAIQQILGALWGTTVAHGAAVMIGAGFSRNAELASATTPAPPLWWHFTHEMEKVLYPQGGAPSDPLRLAEEYRAVLGQPALDSLVFNLIRDGEWLPGRLHDRIISLPWSDILTTNWDTLLERCAAADPDRTYDVVRTIADIATTRAPRIVKLHGSMPSHRPFILAEEDYRTYPREFAPFVNLVQQVLLENELCLLGFSGDDPNFLQWSGWIRDQLGTAARRIYLVGVLNLSPGRRKFLEARNVSPVDLAPLVSHLLTDDKHRAASELFLDYLIKSKPRPPAEWLPQEFPTRAEMLAGVGAPTGTDQTKQIGVALVEGWIEQRLSYPGWLLCPSRFRTRLRHELSHIEGTARALIQLVPAGDSARFLFEIAWRYDTALWPLPAWLQTAISEILPTPTNLSIHERGSLGVMLMRAARLRYDRAAFEQWSTFVNNVNSTDQELIAQSSYEHALWARDSLDFAALAKLLRQFTASDPVWKLRRAGLLCDSGHVDEAWTILKEALSDLRARQARDKRSIWIRSRIAWVMYLARSVRMGNPQLRTVDEPQLPAEWPEHFSAIKCDPWEELQDVDQSISEGFRSQTKRALDERAQFDKGVVSRTVFFGGVTELLPTIEVPQLLDRVGLPLQAGNVNVSRTRLSDSLELLDSNDERDLYLYVRSLSSPSDRVLERRFGRIAVAQIPSEVVDHLVKTLWEAIDFGRRRLISLDEEGRVVSESFWVEAVRIQSEVLSRLILRLGDTRAVEAFRSGLSLANDPNWNHWWLFEPLGNILRRSLEALSSETRGGLLRDALLFPLPDEHGIASGARGPEREWPEITLEIPTRWMKRAPQDSELTHRISALIAKVDEAEPFSRERAALRLARLHEAKLLTSEEITSFGSALWRRRGQNGFPDIDFLPHAYFELPGCDITTVTQLFRNSVLNPAFGQGFTAEFLATVTGACRARPDGSTSFRLTESESATLLGSVVSWRANDRVGLDTNENRVKDMLGDFLANAILLQFEATTIPDKALDDVLQAAKAGYAPSLILALPQVARLSSERSSTAIDLIRNGVFDYREEQVIYSIRAISQWKTLAELGKLEGVPTKLRDAVFTRVLAGYGNGLYSALNVATSMIRTRPISEHEQLALTTALDRLRAETEYDRWDNADPRTPMMTLIRAQCVRLAHTLAKRKVVSDTLSYWTTLTTDPVPEVRYALDDDEDI
jgi:hypothetical protein